MSMSSSTSTSRGGNKRNTNWTRNAFNNDVERKKGTFSKQESDIVRKAIEDFCKEKGVSTERLCSSSDNRTDPLRGSWTEIATCLPYRTVQSVYRHGVRILHPFKRGAWEEDELNQLRILVLRHGRAWALISNKLNRSADACRDKHREFSLNFNKGKWSDEESENLIKIVRSLLKLAPDTSIEQMKDLVLKNRGNNVPWNVVSKRMKNKRSRLACLKRFQQMSGIKHDLTRKWKQRKLEEQLGEDGESTNASASDVTGKRPSGGKGVSRKRSKSDHIQENHVEEDANDGFHASSDSDHVVDVSQSSSVRRLEEESEAPAQRNEVALVPVYGMSRIVPDPTVSEEDIGYDRILLQTLASSSYNRENEVTWSTIRYPNGNAKDRWEEIVDEYLEAHDDVQEDDVFDMPVNHVAKMLLENQRQAEMAARTVDDVLMS